MSHSERLILEASQRRPAVLELIRSTRRRLILSVFRCQDFAILDEIADAVSRGVQVTALLTPSAKNWDKRLQDLGLLLESMGVKMTRYAGEHAKYHAKYMVADDETALVASLNFTSKCFDRTCDFILTTTDPDVVIGLTALFEADRARPPLALPDNLGQRLLVGPEIARGRFASLIAGAQHQIRIIDHRVRDSQIVRLLQERERAGVEVQILGQGDLAGMTSHGKLLLIDEEVAVFGSASLARPSLNERREVAVTVTDPALICQLSEYFTQLAARTPGGVETASSARAADDLEEDEPEP
ncbi:MAG: phospholipase D-like domain-containing protein [Acidobacteria bacterium]|nr:phospholipase D-like domain-containing protein [Acidobacteriota bacterium]